jgi:hypothetical protein
MDPVETIYQFRGFHGWESKCGLRIVPLQNRRAMVICSELPDNPGTSVTNFVEELAALVCAHYGIRPDKLIWIEHYVPHRGHPKPDWDLVTFKVVLGDEKQAVFAQPEWRRMRETDWHECGLPAPESKSRSTRDP